MKTKTGVYAHLSNTGGQETFLCHTETLIKKRNLGRLKINKIKETKSTSRV